MTHQKSSPLYVISVNNLFGLPDEGPWFLAWQNPVWHDDDGYFWTSEDAFLNLLAKHPENNSQPHQFAFKTEEAARDFARSYKPIQRSNYHISKISQ